MLKLAAFLLLMVFFVVDSSCLKAQGRTDDPPDSMPGLQIKRSELFKAFKDLHLDSAFVKSDNVNGLTSYSSIDPRAKITVVGEESNLSLVRIDFMFTTDTALTRKYINKMAGFAYIFALNPGMKWFALRFYEVHIGVPYTSVEKFNFNRQMKFEYFLDKKSMSIIVTPIL